jgi:hypothetical protein
MAFVSFRKVRGLIVFFPLSGFDRYFGSTTLSYSSTCRLAQEKSSFVFTLHRQRFRLPAFRRRQNKLSLARVTRHTVAHVISTQDDPVLGHRVLARPEAGCYKTSANRG